MTKNSPLPQDLSAKGDELFALGDRRGAGAWFGAALQAISKGGVAPPGLQARLEAKLQQLQREQVDHLINSLASEGHTRSNWHRRFAKGLAMMMGALDRPPETRRFPQMPNMFYYPDLPHVEFADTHGWMWLEQIEQETDVILAEASGLLADLGHFGPYVRKSSERPQGDVHGMLENDDWSTFDLFEAGEPVPDRVSMASKTAASITNIAPLCDIPSRAPSIMFSLLKAGKVIPPHTGMFNGRFICHLPLIVPGEGHLRVGASSKIWQIGKILAFDDTVEHDAINKADSDRLVLIFDVWRPELEEIEREQLRAMFRAVDSF